MDGELEAERAGHDIVTIGGFESAEIWVFDLAAPRRPRKLRNTTIDGGPGGYRVSFETPATERTYLALEPAAAKSPQAVVADLPSDLRRRANRADYLIITSSDMVSEAQRLAAYRADQGWRTQVVDVEDIYDEFNWGIVNADAIWSFLRYAYTRWLVAPRYVLLAGEGSSDYKDYLGFGDSVIPTLLAPTPHGLFASDNLYVDVQGNDWLPEMAVGRLPVISAEELAGVTDKLIRYEKGDPEAEDRSWHTSVVVAADESDLGGDFTAAAESIAEIFPDGYHIDRLYLDEPPPPIPGSDCTDYATCMRDALNLGRAFVSFAGHSTHQSLGTLITGSTLDELTNGARLPVVTALTCLAAQFGLPGEESIGERLMIAEDRGAAAVWGPSGLSYNHRARRLGECFYGATFPEDPNAPGELLIGEVILKAQQCYAADGVDIYLLDTYNLLGDPLTVIK